MKKIIIVLSIVCLGTVVKAQESITAFQYSVGFGAGDVGSFIGQPSFRGFTFEWRKYLQPNLSVGLELGWNVFYEAKGNDTYTQGNVSISGKQYRYQNQFPMLATVNYYFKPGEKFNPFVGLGAGTMYSRRNTNMSTYTIEQQAWHFAVKPEIGFLYQMNPETSAFVAIKYYSGLEAGDFNVAQSYFTLNLGLAFTK